MVYKYIIYIYFISKSTDEPLLKKEAVREIADVVGRTFTVLGNRSGRRRRWRRRWRRRGSTMAILMKKGQRGH